MKYTDLIKKLQSPLFSKQDLRLLGAKVFDYQLSLWQQQGHIIKLRNGLYILADVISKLSSEELAGQLYTPSYISLEKALSYYGIIPEMVYAVTCVTPKVTRRFSNKIGTFVYRHVKVSLFFGYREIKGKHASYLLAEPEKALLDYVYFNRVKLKTDADIEGIRFNRHALKGAISRKRLKKYLSVYESDKIENICKKIIGNN